jgi:hypothetical protein
MRLNAAADVMTGTFARVWLVRLKGATNGDENKVFALKILRKVDGRDDCGLRETRG